MNAIVVGISDDEQSHDALSLGAALARTSGARLLVAAAIPDDPIPIETGGHERARREHFDRQFHAVDERLDELSYTALRLESDAPHALEDAAEREGADLIVIGRTHRGLLGRVYPGTTADRMLQASATPIVVAPHGYAEREHAGLGLIGVGYDGGDEAKAALGFAEKLAAALGCTLRLITVAPLYQDIPDVLAPTRESMFRDRLEAGARSVRGVDVEAVLLRDDVAHALASQGVDLDLLVLGSRGHGRVLRAIAGSVASEVVREAPCPVVVVPRFARASDDAARLESQSAREEP